MRSTLAMCLFLSACTVKCTTGDEEPPARVHFSCEGKGFTVECDIAQTQGKREAEACFDFKLTCGNGVVVTAPHTCAKVKDGGTTHVTFTEDQLPGVRTCSGEAPPKMTFSNATINGNPAMP